MKDDNKVLKFTSFPICRTVHCYRFLTQKLYRTISRERNHSHGNPPHFLLETSVPPARLLPVDKHGVLELVIIIVICYRPPTELREANVCLSVHGKEVCVCLSTGGIPCDHYPWCIGLHCTGTPTPVLPSSRHGPPAPPPLDMGPPVQTWQPPTLTLPC